MTLKQRVRKILKRVLAVVVPLALVLSVVAWYKLFRVLPQEFENDGAEELYKYGSIGAEEAEGIPYYIWIVLPRIFPEYLPKDAEGNPPAGGYAAFGTVWEDGHETPVGFSKRTVGFPRVAINCALCHTATWRDSDKGERHVVPTGPSSTFDSLAYLRFLSACATDPRFNAENLLYEIQYNVDVKMSLLDRILYRHVIIPQTKKGLLAQLKRYAWTYEHDRPIWGPGRIDPFNPVKFHQLEMEEDGTIGNADMMPIWGLAGREQMGGGKGHFHWDGLNTNTTEVIHSSALGDGATNKSLPIGHLARIQEFVSDFRPGSNPAMKSLDEGLVQRGMAIYREHCAECHATDGARTATVVPYAEVGTESLRAKMWNQEAADRYNEYSADYGWDFDNFQNTDGYLAVPLEGLWLCGPYLHNGSVPTVRDLLEPPEKRPKSFYRGYDVLDPVNIGFVSGHDTQATVNGFLFDVTLPGNGNQGHTYGTELEAEDKNALVEYLKTL